MNATSNAVAPNAGDDASADSQFTHANLFGIYLTLVFCVLTQPIGSLLMDMPFGARRSILTRIGLLPLPLWRLNPIACGVEGWFILVILCRRAIELWNSKSLMQGNVPHGLRLERLLDGMHIVATGLLIIRANRVDESGKRIVQHLDDLVYADRREDEDEDENVASLSWRDEALPVTGELRPVSRSTYCRPRIDEVLHPGILTRNDGWVDAVTVLSIVTTTAKLAAVTLPWQLRVAMSFMILGWLGVALLVLLGHSRDFDTLDRQAVARETWRLSRPIPWLTDRPWLRESSWHDVALGVFVIPILVYLCYAIVFVFPMWTATTVNFNGPLLSDTYGLAFTPAGLLIFTWRMMLYTFITAIIGFFLLPFFILRTVIPGIFHSCVTGDPPSACICLYILSLTPLYLGYMLLLRYLMDNYPVEFDIGIKVTVFVSTVVLKVWFFATLYQNGSLFLFFSFLNPVILCLGVPAAFELYSPEGSFKPDWLDWLG